MSAEGLDEVQEARRLEALWRGSFGTAYVERNREPLENRQPFWSEMTERHGWSSALEVGCNIGTNLAALAAAGTQEGGGIDVNHGALREAKGRVPGWVIAAAAARRLPFADRSFDLVFTAGVLIHQPSDTLGQVMSEIVRCSRRFVMCIEYFDSEEVEVPYRGQEGALFRRDYGGIYQERFPNLSLVERGELPGPVWDDSTYWLFSV